MPRLQNISKYCVSWRSASVAPSNEYAMLTPSIGCWATPLTAVGCGQPGGFEHGGGDVDHVVELRANLAARGDPARPVDDRAVARSAPVRGDLLRPLVGRVHRVRPADREVVVGLRRAEVVDARGHELGRLERRGAVEDEGLVEAAVDRALGARPVVADDVVDERVLEHAEVVERVDEPSDVVVGVLEEAGVDLHLAGENRLQLIGHVVPGGDLVVPRGQLRLRGHDSELLLPGQDLLAQRVPALRRSGPCTCPTTPSERDAARASPPVRST